MRTQAASPTLAAVSSPGQTVTPTDGSESCPQVDHFDAIATPRAAVRARGQGGKRKRSSLNLVMSIVGLVLSGVIGLAAGCFVLFLISPRHPIIEGLRDLFHPPKVSRKQESPVAPEHASVPVEKKRGPEIAISKPARPVQQENPAPLPIFPPPAISPTEPQPQPPAKSGGDNDASKVPATPQQTPVEVRTEIALDFSRRVKQTKLPPAANGEKAQIRVESITAFETPYQLRPSDGVLHFGQPVGIVLTNFAGVTIDLSLSKNSGATLTVAPKLDTGQGRKIAVTRQWVKQACASSKREADDLDRQLSRAKVDAQSIDLWLKSPVSKPMQLRNTRKQQLTLLNDQVIPGLEKQANDAKGRWELLHRLCELVGKIDQTAIIHLVIRPEAEDGTM